MSTGPQLVSPPEREERNWLPLGIAATVVVVVAAVTFFMLEHGKKTVAVTPISAAPDGYAASLPITGLVMSESANNTGNRTVTGITVQVLFRTFAHEVAQNETQPLTFIRMRSPYIDVEPVSAAPLKPGQGQDFRLIFDAVSPDWDGAYPEVRVVKVEGR